MYMKVIPGRPAQYHFHVFCATINGTGLGTRLQNHQVLVAIAMYPTITTLFVM